MIERDLVMNDFIDILEDKLGVDKHEITETTNLKNDLGMDSLDDIEIIMECENKFGIMIADDDAEKVTTIKEAIDLIYKLQCGGK